MTITIKDQIIYELSVGTFTFQKVKVSHAHFDSEYLGRGEIC